VKKREGLKDKRRKKGRVNRGYLQCRRTTEVVTTGKDGKQGGGNRLPEPPSCPETINLLRKKRKGCQRGLIQVDCLVPKFSSISRGGVAGEAKGGSKYFVWGKEGWPTWDIRGGLSRKRKRVH